ncbi:MAG: MaoC family dehydratase N-terminal domain-containing protein [Gemmatimonadota bacterium]
MWEDRVGTKSETVRNVVERGAVRKFAQAIGDLNPLYLDPETAARSRWGRLIAPPTFPRVFDFGTIPGLPLPPAGIIHGEQSYTYTRPLHVGEEVDCYTIFQESYSRKGSGGTLNFLVFERVGEDTAGERIFTSRDVLILTETVAAGVES